jgi:hypothetical protein
VATAYERLTAAAKQDLAGDAVSTALEKLVGLALTFLKTCKRTPLTSNVVGKSYFAFQPPRESGKLSRPVNDNLFSADLTERHLGRVVRGDLSALDAAKRAKVLYSTAMSYCAATDLLKEGDKKTPGTFFECLVGHLVAKSFGVNPKTAIEVLNLDLRTNLPTDYVFDLGAGRNKIHLPIKTSTRERVVQVWAHQRVLDGVYGMNRFRGLLVCLTETNMQRQTLSVVEVCLPDQWVLYQMFISQLHRVYYFDPPAKYASLATRYPFIQVKPFAAFFDEIEVLATAAPLA